MILAVCIRFPNLTLDITNNLIVGLLVSKMREAPGSNPGLRPVFLVFWRFEKRGHVRSRSFFFSAIERAKFFLLNRAPTLSFSLQYFGQLYLRERLVASSEPSRRDGALHLHSLTHSACGLGCCIICLAIWRFRVLSRYKTESWPADHSMRVVPFLMVLRE